MDDKDQFVGKRARLPDGQKVVIRTVFDDGFALCTRLGGRNRGMRAVGLLDKLTIEPR
jgi:hypothetical protein